MSRYELTDEEFERAIEAYRRIMPHLEPLFLTETGPFGWPAGGWRSTLSALAKNFFACNFVCVDMEYTEAMRRLEAHGGGRFHAKYPTLRNVMNAMEQCFRYCPSLHQLYRMNPPNLAALVDGEFPVPLEAQFTRVKNNVELVVFHSGLHAVGRPIWGDPQDPNYKDVDRIPPWAGFPKQKKKQYTDFAETLRSECAKVFMSVKMVSLNEYTFQDYQHPIVNYAMSLDYVNKVIEDWGGLNRACHRVIVVIVPTHCDLLKPENHDWG